MPWGVAVAVAGSAVSGMMADKGGSSQTTSSEPWEPSQEWLKENIDLGRELQGHYRQNPFNQLQQTGYQNLFGDIDMFRNSMAPGLMGYANNLMGARYQRAPAGSELGVNPYNMGGAARMSQGLLSTHGPVAQRTPTQSGVQGLLGSGQGQPQGDMRSAMAAMAGQGSPLAAGSISDAFGQAGQMGQSMPQAMGQAAAGVFPTSMGGGSYGSLDWQNLNPYTSNLKPEDKPIAEKPQLTEDLIEQWMRENDPSFLQRRETWRTGDGGA